MRTALALFALLIGISGTTVITRLWCTANTSTIPRIAS
jgi:hypothetical protein